MNAPAFAPTRPRLSALLGREFRFTRADDPLVSGLAADSRRVQPGWLFAACAGARRHGLEFLDQAVKAGAAAVLWEPASEVQAPQDATVPVIRFPGLSSRLGDLAARVHGHPSEDVALVGVTGTDGKTSVSQFLAQALSLDDGGCGVIGTLGYGLHGGLAPGQHTTPDAARVQELLAGFRDAGARYASMEVSSHALSQHRVAGARFRVAVLTNLGRDHLDYHRTEQGYAEAKRRLFTHPGLEVAVLNLDDSFGCSVRRSLHPGIRRIGYSLQSDSDAHVVVISLRPHGGGLCMEVVTPVGLVQVDAPVIGRFNAQNLLAVIGALVGLGWGADRITEALRRIRPVPGRMECFGGEGGPLMVVDYAHTGGALDAALRALGEHVSGRIWCVFGCGGGRDTGKRALMAAAAEARAHHVIVTDDNPRNEDPERIIADILAGFRRRRPRVERDRASAIRLAFSEAGPGDAVLVAGKGHEDYQITAEGVRHYSDRETVRALLEEAP